MPDDKKSDYKVGYKKPPLHTRFKKGQSGNPSGRPKGSKNFSTLLAEAQATKMLLGLMLERERLAAAAAPAERPSFGAADKQVIANLLKRLRSSE